MVEALKKFLGPEYLVVAEPGPMGGLWILYLALGLLFAGGGATAVWVLSGPGRQGRETALRAWAWFELWICLAGLGTVTGRFLGWPGWSARIWPYSLALLALGGVAAYLSRRWRLPPWLAAQMRVLALSPGPRLQAPALWYLLALAVHLAGTGLVLSARTGWPWWAAPLVLLALLAPQAPVMAHGPDGAGAAGEIRQRVPSLMALSPLLGAYAATALWLLYRWQGLTVIGWQGLAFPNPMVSLFYVDGIILGAVAYTVLCQLGFTAHAMARPAILWRGTAAGLLVLTVAWAGAVYLGKRTHGATASDPYAYAQMGVDLAERGTFLHRFSLFEAVMPLQIAWAPLQPVGYHIPRNERGDCPSVWATGASVLLAAGYQLLGESGLYVTTPIVALLALAATWALVQETLRGEGRPVRYLTGAVTVALLASSPEHVDRLLVPMADAPAQLFTVLTLVFALRGMRQLRAGQRGTWSFLLAGVAFAWAYWVRHTQLVLALPAILAVGLGVWGVEGDRQEEQSPPLSNAHGTPASRSRWARAIWPLAVFFGAALLAALPDIAYRWRTFGGPLATETTELPLMALQHVGPVAWQMLRDALVAGEWGYLFPLAIYGGYRLARAHRQQAALLGSALAAVLLVHLTYHSLRLRDLISLFPLMDLAVAYGAVTLVHRVRSLAAHQRQIPRLGRALLPVAAITWVVLSLALSRWFMTGSPWRPGWASFGYMEPQQRAAFGRLADLTPPQSIIGASLNAGAVMMYTGRDAIRPYDSWTGEEWNTFLEAMRAAERPVYLLDDGGLMAAFIAREGTGRRLTPIEELEVPLFYTQDPDSGWLYRLEWEP